MFLIFAKSYSVSPKLHAFLPRECPRDMRVISKNVPANQTSGKVWGISEEHQYREMIKKRHAPANTITQPARLLCSAAFCCSRRASSKESSGCLQTRSVDAEQITQLQNRVGSVDKRLLRRSKISSCLHVHQLVYRNANSAVVKQYFHPI